MQRKIALPHVDFLFCIYFYSLVWIQTLFRLKAQLCTETEHWFCVYTQYFTPKRYDVWNQTQQLRLKTKCYKKYKILLNWSQLSAVATQKKTVFKNFIQITQRTSICVCLVVRIRSLCIKWYQILIILQRKENRTKQNKWIGLHKKRHSIYWITYYMYYVTIVLKHFR